MEHEQVIPSPVSREKLGLSLAGGGFRASLFHLGVLRRMAELDLLRRVEVVSTVSGGSIVGALYVLVLKKRLEAAPDGQLDRDGYVEVVEEVEEALLAGIRKNLRTRLFMNPAGVLRVLLTPLSLGQRMARLYERHLYADVVEEIRSASVLERTVRPGRLPLRELRIRPGGAAMERGVEAYNRRAVAEERPVATRLVINATSLNSGARFWFSGTEVGDWPLGQVRHDEVEVLEARKALLEGAEPPSGVELPAGARGLARWWRSRDGGEPGAPPSGGHWDPLFRHPGFPGALVSADPGLLRKAKLPAWYLVHGLNRKPPVTGGRPGHEHWFLLWVALARIDPDLERSLRPRVSDEPALAGLLLEFLLELYWLRTAEVASDRIGRFWQRTTVGDAVGASANFPPVFPPFQLPGLYDDLHVSRLGLTDGGVFDNMGLAALVDEGCTQIIASDTSGLFTERERASSGRVNMLARLESVLRKVVASHQREALRERRRVSRQIEPHASEDEGWRRFLDPRRLSALAYFHIDSPPVDVAPSGKEGPEGPGQDPPPPAAFDPEVRRALASLRTDLDAFGDLEIAGLVNHGYGTADRYIRRYFGPEETRAPLRNPYWEEPPPPPVKLDVPEPRFRRALAAGGSRFFRALRMRAPLSWAVTVAVGAALLWWTWDLWVSAGEAARWLADASVAAVAAMAPWLGPAWPEYALPVFWVLLAALVVMVVLPRVTGFSPVDWLRDRGRVRWARRLASVAKWGRALSGNVLWVLGLFPVLLALGVSLVAAVSHFFFSRPYLRATRHRGPRPRKASGGRNGAVPATDSRRSPHP